MMIGRRVESVADVEQPGDYCGPLNGGSVTDYLDTCFFLTPNSRDDNAPTADRSIQYVTFPPHAYRECDDGSLEIRPSIGHPSRRAEGDGWHGFLDEGHVWRPAPIEGADGG